MEFWAILLLSVTLAFFVIFGTIQLIRRVPDIPLDKSSGDVIVQIESCDHLKEEQDSSLDEDEPLQILAQNLTLKRSASVKYKDNHNIKKVSSPIENGKLRKNFQGYYNTLPTPPSTPTWKRQLSIVKSGSISSVESNDLALDSLEEKFSHSIEMNPKDIDRAAAVAFLKSKFQERSGLYSESEIQFCTPPRSFKGKRLERIPTNEI